MASETGAEAFIRQQQAIISQPDSRPDLACIDCPTEFAPVACSQNTERRN